MHRLGPADGPVGGGESFFVFAARVAHRPERAQHFDLAPCVVHLQPETVRPRQCRKGRLVVSAAVLHGREVRFGKPFAPLISGLTKDRGGLFQQRVGVGVLALRRMDRARVLQTPALTAQIAGGAVGLQRLLEHRERRTGPGPVPLECAQVQEAVGDAGAVSLLPAYRERLCVQPRRFLGVADLRLQESQ